MVKNRLTSILVVALALGMSASSLFAQNQGGGQGGGRGGRGGFGGGFGGGQTEVLSLISNEAVVKELALSEEASGKLKKVSEERRAELGKSRGDFAGLRDLPEAERATKMAEMRQKGEEAAKKARETYLPQVKAILTPAQYERVQQIAWQAQRTAAYSDPEVVKALALTQDQQDKIAAANKDYSEKSRALGFGGDNREKRDELSKARDSQIAAVVTADQATKFTALKGKEFDLAQLRPAGGPGGGRGGQGGNRGGAGRPATE
jgi:hypothetical protein